MYGQHDPSMTLQHPSMVRTNPSMVRRNSSMVMITYLWSGGPMYGQHDPSMPLEDPPMLRKTHLPTYPHYVPSTILEDSSMTLPEDLSPYCSSSRPTPSLGGATPAAEHPGCRAAAPAASRRN